MPEYGTVEDIKVESDSLFQNEAVNTSYHGFSTKKLLTVVVAAMSGVAFFSAGYYKGLTKSFLGNNAMSMAHMVEPPPLGAGECKPAGYMCNRIDYNSNRITGDCAKECCSGEKVLLYRSQWSEASNCK